MIYELLAFGADLLVEAEIPLAIFALLFLLVLRGGFITMPELEAAESMILLGMGRAGLIGIVPKSAPEEDVAEGVAPLLGVAAEAVVLGEAIVSSKRRFLEINIFRKAGVKVVAHEHVGAERTLN